ncbi:MAG: hypothetical protein M1818_001278 [Claussenomyces sp. TS43310]|nr:MAG: hypothetical protein M1818_001278 [Claussenomyces sp. TS43310]
MALARSASGPGGLSINTGSANSLFGSSSTSQAPASGSLFGGASKPASGGLFGASATTTPAPQSQSLFGNTTTSTMAAPQSSNQFGSAPANSQPQQSGGLFGSSTTTTQPQQSGGLFGSTTTNTNAQPSGGLFGNSTSNPPQSGGLFGATQPAQNQSTTGGLFGGNTASQQPAASGGLFGGLNSQSQNKPAASSMFGGNNTQTQQAQPQQSSSLFSSLNNKPAQSTGGGTFGNSLGGGLTMGQSTNQAPQTVPGVRIDISNVRSTTRFNDLHEDLQKLIENVDKVILNSIQQSQDISAIMPSHDEQLAFVPDNVDFLSRKLLGVESSLESDAETIAHLKTLADKDHANASMSFKAINELALPQQYHQRHAWSSSNAALTDASSATSHDLVSFFSRTADDMSATLSTYQARVAEIETHLRSVEAATLHQAQLLSAGAPSATDDRGREIRELALVLREFEQGILGVAGTVGRARQDVQKLQLGPFEHLRSQHAARTNANGKRSGIY